MLITDNYCFNMFIYNEQTSFVSTECELSMLQSYYNFSMKRTNYKKISKKSSYLPFLMTFSIVFYRLWGGNNAFGVIWNNVGAQ